MARLIPCFGDFWLDEIWTYFTARGLASPWEVFTSIHDSNNNHLNTLLVYIFGDRTFWPAYRVPSLLAGVGGVGLATGIAWRRGRLEAVFTALLFSACFALLHFSSEARGYALAVFFALAAYWALERELERKTRWGAPLFGICTVLGFLSHLTFLFFYAGALVQSAWRSWGGRGAAAPRLLALARLHLAPVACLLALYWLDLRQLSVGGGYPTDFQQLLARTFGFTFGLPVVRGFALAYTALAIAVLIPALHLLRREGSDEWLLHLVTIVLAPLLVLAVMRPQVVAVRYFLIGIAFYLLLASYLLADLYRRGGWRRGLGLAAVALFLLGNANHTAAFLRLGRGGYLDALEFMAHHTAGTRVVVGSDHDFRNGMVLRFYARHLPAGKRLVYAARGSRPPGGPDWLITHYPARPTATPTTIRDPAGNAYRLAADFDHGAISGFYWAVYRNASETSRAGGS